MSNPTPIQLFIRDPWIVFNYNGKSISFSDSSIPYEYYNDSNTSKINVTEGKLSITRNDHWLLDINSIDLKSVYQIL